LFIIAVLCFILGIYLGAINTYPLKYIAVAVLVGASITPFFIARYRRTCIVLIFICFCLTGIIRVSVLVNSTEKITLDNERYIFEGKIVEASKNTKVLRLSSPATFEGIHVVLKTDKGLNIGDSIRIFGGITELNQTFKNPYIISWRWLKNLEGIHYEIRGVISGVKEGDNPVVRVQRLIQRKVYESEAKHSGIIGALIIGDKTSIDEDTKALFQRTGTSHILAISGLHIGIITGFFFSIIRWLLGRKGVLRLSGRDKRYAALITIIFPFVFMLISGSGVSTIRATIMVTIFMLSIFFERQRDIINTIAVSALIILLIYPHSLFMPSFQLSFLCVLFIVLIMKRIYPFLKIGCRPVRWLVLSSLATLSATIGTLPVVVYHFYGVNIFSVLHNLISIPLMCIISIPLCLIGILIPYGGYLIKLAGEIINLNLSLLRIMDYGYIFPVIRPNLPELALFYSVLLSFIFLDTRAVRYALYFIVSPLLFIQIYLAWDSRFNNNLCLNLIDVGMGESMLLEAPKGIRILIDGGGGYRGDFDAGKNIITPILLSKKIKTLDYVINTHPHSDHTGGLPYILKNFNVKTFVTGGYFIREPGFIELIKISKDKKIDIQLWREGDGLILRDGMVLKVLNPPKDFTGENLNNASLVLMIIYRNASFLLTGDIESDIEKTLVMNNMPLKADILKVPHHGSNNSSCMAFLMAVRPRLAVMSVGTGIKGLPGKEVLKRYKELLIPVLSTLESGFIRICTDGRRITYSTEVKKQRINSLKDAKKDKGSNKILMGRRGL